jgi:hypothetical protein
MLEEVQLTCGLELVERLLPVNQDLVVEEQEMVLQVVQTVLMDLVVEEVVVEA